MNEIEAVIINWKRPANVAKIVEALRLQSQPCTITICDCHPSEEFALTEKTLSSIDRLYRWTHNLGAFSRYVPIGAYDHPFTLFLDDDMLPGRRCIEHFFESARTIGNFGALGQMGRIISGNGSYISQEVPRTDMLIEVDILVRGIFIKTCNIFYIMQLRWMMEYFDNPLPEDDLLLSVSLRVCANLPCYLTPLCQDRETLMNKKELDNQFALSHRPEHLKKRKEFIQRAIGVGWTPLLSRSVKGAINYVVDSKDSLGRGVLYLALGETCKHLSIKSMSALRQHGYVGPIRVITDTSGWELEQLKYQLIRVPSVGLGFNTRYYKTMLYQFAFDCTLFLDSDTLPLASIDGIWEELSSADICMCSDMYVTVGELISECSTDPQRRRLEYEFMESSGLLEHSHFNSGVMLFRKSAQTESLFAVWHDEWKRFENEDQLALIRAIAHTNTKVHILPQRWNCFRQGGLL